jgi:DNA/RNA endonuclease YhcR with UshA esterase domain
MNRNTKCLLIGAGLVMAVVQRPASAHHAFAAEFDANKPVTLKGAVTKVEWMNPHIWVYLDVKDDKGTLEHWQCEGGAPNTLTRNGWSKDSLKFGDQITVDGLLAKDGSKTCNARAVKLPDGRSVLAGSSAPQPKP